MISQNEGKFTREENLILSLDSQCGDLNVHEEHNIIIWGTYATGTYQNLIKFTPNTTACILFCP